MIPERLAQAGSFGCETVDLRQDATLAEQIEQIVGEPEVDAAVDCVGFEARGHSADAVSEPSGHCSERDDGDHTSREALLGSPVFTLREIQVPPMRMPKPVC